MTIRDPHAYVRSLWNWACLRGCFPRSIEPTDIDGFVEIGGYFLVLESKGPGKPLEEGQRKAFERMMRWNHTVPGLFTVIVFWGDPAVPRVDRVQFWPNEPIESNLESLRSYCQAWSECAEERAAIQNDVVLT
jgi:hypothetical protein